MEFLAHRGLWFKKEEKNTLAALCKALDEGYGLETDIRDCHGKLVISHDIPEGPSLLLAEDLFSYYQTHGSTSCLALNIKADGLQERLRQQLENYGITHYFVFDMSIPDTLGYLKANQSTFIRRSDLENHPELFSRVQGVWLDELLAPWIDYKVILEYSSAKGALCIVSSELHGRDYSFQWKEIKKALEAGFPSEKLLLCTDLPREAQKFFL